MRNEKATVKVKKTTLNKVIENLSAVKKSEVIDTIAELTGASIPTVYRMLAIGAEVKPIYRPFIAKALKMKVTELF